MCGWISQKELCMSLERPEDHLSRITTCWSQVFQAHSGGTDTVAAARCQLLERYCGAIYRYAFGALGDADAAEEILQEFAYCFMRGDFHGANPHRGRFRDLVKTVLFHLIVNYQRQQHKLSRERLIADCSDFLDPHEEGLDQAVENEFLKLWREELLERTWQALAEHQRHGGHAWYTVLQRHAENPAMPSEQLAQQLSLQSGRAFTASGVRQILRRARVKFALLLIAEIGRSLETAHRDAIEQELIALDLLVYCKSTLEKKFPRT